MPKQVKFVDFEIPNTRAFFNLIALPNVREFEATPNVHSALNAAWALCHICEWRWHELGTAEKLSDFRQRVCALCPELQQLRDITDAAKHRGVSRDSHGVKKVSTASGRGGAGGWNVPSGGYGVGAVAWGSGEPELRVVFDDDSAQWLPEIIKAATDFWSRTLIGTAAA